MLGRTSVSGSKLLSCTDDEVSRSGQANARATDIRTYGSNRLSSVDGERSPRQYTRQRPTNRQWAQMSSVGSLRCKTPGGSLGLEYEIRYFNILYNIQDSEEKL